MEWGFLTTQHIISLVVAVIIIVLGLFGLSKVSRKTQSIILFICSLSGISAILFNLFMWNSPLEYLPFHMCSINAIILPFVVISKNKIIGNLLLVWCLGALIALILNVGVMNCKIFDKVFCFYYFPHVLEFLVPIALFKLKLIKLDYKCIVSTIIITMLIYTGVHFINVGINNYCIKNNILDSSGNIIKVNYMFSIFPENPLLQLFYKIIPHSYWYMYLSVIILFVYLVLIYFKQIYQNVFKKQKA